jgi:hypothetical protein
MTKNTSAAPRKAIRTMPPSRRDAGARLIAAMNCDSAYFHRPELVGEVRVGQLHEALDVRAHRLWMFEQKQGSTGKSSATSRSASAALRLRDHSGATIEQVVHLLAPVEMDVAKALEPTISPRPSRGIDNRANP